MTQYRTPKGKFVKRSNPIAVIGNANARVTRERDRAAAAQLASRRARVPNGIVTREDLAALAIAATAGE